jgi:SulP family sulfate permease
VDAHDQLRERHDEHPFHRSPSIRVLHIEGNLFFGAASELQRALDEACRPPSVKVLVVRLRRTQAMDMTTAYVRLAVARSLQQQGRHVLLVGIRPRPMNMLVRTGLAAAWGEQDLFPTQLGWFAAMDKALMRATALADTPEDCPIRRYLRKRSRRTTPAID